MQKEARVFIKQCIIICVIINPIDYATHEILIVNISENAY